MNQFCYDCKENACKLDSKKHFAHKMTFLSQLENDFENSKEIIKKKNKELLKIIGINEAILNSFDKHKNNYFYLKSLKNVSKSFEREIQMILYFS